MSEINPIEAMVSRMRATADAPNASSLLEEFCGWGADRDFVALVRAALTALSENITVEMVEAGDYECLGDIRQDPAAILRAMLNQAIKGQG